MNYNERLSKIRELCIERIKQHTEVNDADREKLHRCILDLIYSSKGRSFIGYCDSFIKEYEKTFDDKIREALVRLYLIMTVGDKAKCHILNIYLANKNRIKPFATGGGGDAPGGGSPTEPPLPEGCATGGGSEDDPEPMPPGDPVSVSNKGSPPKKATSDGCDGTIISQEFYKNDLIQVFQSKNPVAIKENAYGENGEDLPRITENTSSINKSTQDQKKGLENAISREQNIIELIASIVYNSVKTQKEKGI